MGCRFWVKADEIKDQLLGHYMLFLRVSDVSSIPSEIVWTLCLKGSPLEILTLVEQR
jgi:hypothetical protein